MRNIKKLEKELKRTQNHKTQYYVAKQANDNPDSKETEAVKKERHEFTNDVKVSNHFIIRAQERFGIRDLGNYDDNYKIAVSWARNILSNYDTITEQDNNTWLVSYKKIVIIYDYTSDTCVTCYSLCYSELTKEYDTLKTTLAKRELKLDETMQTKVDDALHNLYYQEVRKLGKVLTDYYTETGKLYQEITNSKRNNSVDEKQEIIMQNRSIIYDMENKLQALHDVVF